MKKAHWGFSYKKSKIHFLKQLCLYFNYMKLTIYKKKDLPFKKTILFAYFQKEIFLHIFKINWFISKLMRTFYNNIKKYDLMFKIREKKFKNLKVKSDN